MISHPHAQRRGGGGEGSCRSRGSTLPQEDEERIKLERMLKMHSCMGKS